MIKRVCPFPIVYPFTAKTKLIIERGMTGATGNVYAGLHEFEHMSFLLHFLRPEDLFADVGANMGTYTILASGQVGCKSFAFEPIPITFEKLKNNIAINGITSRVAAINMGVGEQFTTLRFSSELDTINHVLTSGENVSSVEVTVETLDAIFHSEIPVLLKIDVEGFEMSVLRGAKNILGNSALSAIIIELNTSGLKYGYTDQEIMDVLLLSGFQPYSYDPFQRKLSSGQYKGEGNMLFIRDTELANKRVLDSEAFSVLDLSI